MFEQRERGRLEAQALACVRLVLARLQAPDTEALWLSYRLFTWWFAIAVDHELGVLPALKDLAQFRPVAQMQFGDDAAEPTQWSADFDVRLSSVLNALAVCPDLVRHWAKQKEKRAWSASLSAASIECLAALASENIGDEPASSKAMDWVPPLRVSTAALVALLRNGGKFTTLSPAAREAWLSWIPMTPAEAEHRPFTVALQVIHFALVELSALSEYERALLADRCLRSEALAIKESPITAIAIAHAAGHKLVSLGDAFARAKPHLRDSDVGRILVSVFLDSVLDVSPERARPYSLEVLQLIGRDVASETLIDVVRSEISFADQEPVRARLLKHLESEAQPAPHTSPLS